MSEINPAAQAEFLSQLNKERDAIREFVALLEKEQQALLQQENDLLLTLAEAKTQAALKLNELTNVRRQFLNSKMGNNAIDSSEWIKKFAPTCLAAWNEVKKIAEAAHQMNKTNGEVIQLKLRSNQQALTALLGAAKSAAGLYGRDGQTSVAFSGRTLGSG